MPDAPRSYPRWTILDRSADLLPPADFSFMFITDSHLGGAPTEKPDEHTVEASHRDVLWNQGAGLTPPRTALAMDQANASGLDFVVCGGDQSTSMPYLPHFHIEAEMSGKWSHGLLGPLHRGRVQGLEGFGAKAASARLGLLLTHR